MGLPGVRVGPLDPDATESFGAVNAQLKARRLLRLHAAQSPPVLTRQLARKLDVERTKAVHKHLPEVREYLAGLDLPNGDPLVPEGAEVVGASVRGERDTEQVLTFTYRTESGRTGKWFAPYNPDGIPDAAELGDALVKASDMKERGIVAFDEGAAQAELLRNELGRSRRENEALRASIEGRGDMPGDLERIDSAVSGVDTRPAEKIAAEVQELRAANREMAARLATLEGALGERAQADVSERGSRAAQRQRESRGQSRETEDALAGSGTDEEPVEGYDEMNASEAQKLLRSDDLDDEQREAILEYERQHRNRASVVRVGEGRLGPGSS